MHSKFSSMMKHYVIAIMVRTKFKFTCFIRILNLIINLVRARTRTARAPVEAADRLIRWRCTAR
eukprot:SAG31_NODE_4921_length_2864_cov_1.618445_1_plen_64_part_00